MDLIKREDAIKAVRESKPWHFNEIVPVLSAIKGIPSAEPKHGMWERIPYSFVGGFRCSCCGTKTLEKHWNFCPNCGCDMRGGSANER